MFLSLVGLCFLAAFFVVHKSGNIIPHRMVYIIERFGKYNRTLESGFHLIMPFIDRVAYKHSLKEKAIEVPQQVCITKDNVAVEVDGLLYLHIIDPEKASYGINDYLFATVQITQTTIRSTIGKLDLDQSFKERENINAQIVAAIDKASDAWGVKVNRYEIKDIKPPKTINDAMEKQMRAEREKRAIIAQSEGEMQARINRAEGERHELIARSESKAFEITKIAQATADGIIMTAKAIKIDGGKDAVSLRLAEQYISEFGELAKTNNTMIIPSNLADFSSVIAAATSIYKHEAKKDFAEDFLKKKLEKPLVEK
jgi:regulator of protease activity HflC (stomatin/prohibitin superfamily)